MSDKKLISIVAHDSTLAALNSMLFDDYAMQPSYADFLVIEICENGLKLFLNYRNEKIESERIY